MSRDSDPMAGDAGIPRTVDWYVESFPKVAMKFLARMRSESGYGAEHKRWRAVSNVLFFYGRGGPFAVPPAGFKDLLIKSMDRADSENLARFALGFPDMALAVWICKQMPGGTDLLEEALRIAEQIDTPAARAILGTPFETASGTVMVSSPGAETRGFQPAEAPRPGSGIPPRGVVHTPHHGKTDSSPIPWRNADGSL